MLTRRMIRKPLQLNNERKKDEKVAKVVKKAKAPMRDIGGGNEKKEVVDEVSKSKEGDLSFGKQMNTPDAIIPAVTTLDSSKVEKTESKKFVNPSEKLTLRRSPQGGKKTKRHLPQKKKKFLVYFRFNQLVLRILKKPKN